MTSEEGKENSSEVEGTLEDFLLEEKPWWMSKTLWANIVAVAVILIQGWTGYVIPPEDQVIILGFVNMVLRWISKSELYV